MAGNTLKYTTLLGTALLFFACTKKDSLTAVAAEPAGQTTAYEGVDEALWPYFESFEKEARLRGLEVDLREAAITGVIEALPDDGVAGQCSYSSHQPNHVTIDLEFWSKSGTLFREFVVFHELGHCRLARDHREAVNADGTCASLMRSGLEDCRDNYNRVTRSSYLDELFDPAFFNTIHPGIE
ncbi:MAG: hypothetical protein KDD19_14705 [Phaeodactylibacter sp.]|nr:hypothetical protein [Phaeodactylibacter sp.]MCB9052866.1 hypothetical protein [Lewinellaceae bacterium]